jgi:hypothetical protein
MSEIGKEIYQTSLHIQWNKRKAQLVEEFLQKAEEEFTSEIHELARVLTGMVDIWQRQIYVHVVDLSDKTLPKAVRDIIERAIENDKSNEEEERARCDAEKHQVSEQEGG